jgi:hypothetical protein
MVGLYEIWEIIKRLKLKNLKCKGKSLFEIMKFINDENIFFEKLTVSNTIFDSTIR